MKKAVKYKIHLIDGTVIFVIDPEGRSVDQHKIDARNKFGDMFKRLEQI